MIIYKTTNLINGKIYVGQTVRMDPNYLGVWYKIEKRNKQVWEREFY